MDISRLHLALAAVIIMLPPHITTHVWAVDAGHSYYNVDTPSVMDIASTSAPPSEGLLHDYMFDTEAMAWRK